MDTTLDGKVMLSNSSQPLNALLDIPVRLDGNDTLVNFVHSLKAPVGSVVIEEGILIVVSDVHPEKTLVPTDVIVEGSVTLTNEVQSLKISSESVVIEEGRLIVVSDVHPEKAPIPIEVTPSGILIISRSLDPANALLLIYVIDDPKTVDGISILFAELFVPSI